MAITRLVEFEGGLVHCDVEYNDATRRVINIIAVHHGTLGSVRVTITRPNGTTFAQGVFLQGQELTSVVGGNVNLEVQADGSVAFPEGYIVRFQYPA